MTSPANHDEYRWELSILVGPCTQEAAEEFLLAIQHKFMGHLGAVYVLTQYDEFEDYKADYPDDWYWFSYGEEDTPELRAKWVRHLTAALEGMKGEEAVE